MKSYSLLGAVLALVLMLGTTDAEAAKRLGSGWSSGMQRQVDAPAKSPVAAPAQTPSASTAAKAPATATAAAAAQPKRSWMGPIAGLAAGLGLAALASHLGLGEAFGTLMMIALLLMVAVAVVAFVARRRAAALQPAMAGTGGMHYAAPVPEPAGAFRQADIDARASAPSAIGAVAAGAAKIPVDFDVAGFVRQAKVNFIRLQAANDGRNLDDLREFTTPEMFAEVKTTILGRGDAEQHTDVLEIDAEVLDVVEEPSRYVVSVRYSGLVREGRDSAGEEIDEIWHLVKSRTGTGGWLLAGIQQVK